MKLHLCAAAALLCALPVASPAQETTTRTIQMAPATATLTKTLDAKKNKEGDPVMAKLEKDVKLDETTTLPKGSMLIGKVDQVQPSENKGESSIQITFDQAQTRDGKTVPIKATIMQIAAPVNAMSMNEPGSDTNGGPMPPQSSNTPMTAGSGGASASPSQTAGQGPSQGPGMAPGSMPNPGAQPSEVTQKSGYRGVTLKSDIHDKDSGSFIDKKKNVHLSSGTRLEFAVAPAPTASAMQ